MSIENEERFAFDLLNARDYQRAKEIFKSLAERGSISALNALGWMHETGAAGQIDHIKAIKYYRRAADGGLGEAFYNLGTLLQEMHDKIGAQAALKQGAQLGDLRSMTQWGSTLIEAAEDERERAEGIMWLEKAASEGHFFAKRKLLALELRRSRSLLRKPIFAWKVLHLVIRGAFLYLQDSTSRKL